MAYKSGLWQICLVDGVYNTYKFWGPTLHKQDQTSLIPQERLTSWQWRWWIIRRVKTKLDAKIIHHGIMTLYVQYIYIYSKISYNICLSTMYIYIYIPMQIHAAASSYAPKAVSLGIWVSLFFCPAGCVGAGRAMSRVARSVEAGDLDDFCRPVS